MDRAPSPSRLQTLRALSLAGLTAFCMLLPFFWFGDPSGHDFEFHFNSWIEVLGQWEHGIIYPHWSQWSHFGYGEVRFIFYPPASWALGAALGAILPWKFVAFAYDWIALTFAGTAMFLLARRCLSSRDALFAAAFYTVNPYFWIVVYWRSAQAELLSAAYFPLLLFYAFQLNDEGARVMAPLSLINAAAWLTNIPSAIMMIYSLGLLTLWIAISKRSWKPILHAASSVALGIVVAAVYLLPVWHQHNWVDLSQVLSPGVRPADNFLFSKTTDRDHDLFNRIVSVVAVCEIAILTIALWLARRSAGKKLWRPLAILGTACTLVLFNFTLPLWNHLPELRYVQFPWRWLLVMNVVLAIAVTIAFRRWWLRILICALALSSVAFGWRKIQAPWWDNASDIQEMVDNQQDGIGNDGVDEYLPIAVDSDNVDQNAPLTTYVGTGSAKVAIELWETEHRVIRADATAPGDLVLRLFNYPLWKVEVNDQRVTTQSAEHTGQMIIPIAAGENAIQIQYVEGWDRKAGAGISVLGLAIVFVLWRTTRQPNSKSAKLRP